MHAISPLNSTPDWTTSGVACNHLPWTAQMARRRQKLHARMGLGQHKWSYDVRCYMPSSTLRITHDRMTPGMALSHGPWETHMVGRRRAWHGLVALGLHTPSDIVGHFMQSSPLGSTHNRTTLGVACNHRFWKAYTTEQRQAWCVNISLENHTRSDDVGCCMPVWTL